MVYEGTTTTAKSWLYADHLGSIVGTADATGTSTAIYSYGPYGEPNTTTGQRFRYTGQQLISGLGLYYYKARFYSPALGRFLQTDPIGTADDLNLYAYVGNSPVNFTDPSGLMAAEAKMLGGKIASAATLGNASNFAAGVGDTLTFGGTAYVRELLDIGSVDRSSGAYLAGEITGVGASAATGAGVGLRMAGSAGKGLEFSHWIPNRMGGAKSLLNGNYVTTVVHALSDPYRYRFMPRAWKALNPMPSVVIQQWNRVPNIWKGTAAGAAYGGASAGSE